MTPSLPAEDPAAEPPSPARRALLALGGLLAFARASAAAQAPAPAANPSATAEARLKLAREAMDAIRAHVGRGQFNPGERDPIAIWSRRRLDARLELSKTRAD